MVAACRIDGQSIEGDDHDLDARMLGDGPRHLFQQVDAGLGVDQRLLAVVDAYAQHQLVDHAGSPRDDVEVAIGDRVEGAGVKAGACHVSVLSRPSRCRRP